MIHLDLRDNVAIISLDSPKGNLLQYGDLIELRELFYSEKLISANGVIITGMNRSFCTGLDLLNSPFSAFETFKLLDKVLLLLYSYKKPLIIAAPGHIIGAGFLFLMCADYIYMPKQLKIKIGLPEINIGLGLDPLMLLLIKESFSPLKIKHLLYNGLYMTCQDLFNNGVVNAYVEDNDLISISLDLINNDVLNKYDAFLYCKKLLRAENISTMQMLFKNQCYSELSNLYQKKLHD